jgi:sulfite exporter TauE/SafE
LDSVAMSIGVLVSAWLVGTLGGLHCVAMCGGLLGAIGARDASRTQPLQSARAIVARQATYHAGRLVTYSLLGALFGAFGAATLGIVDLLPLQRAIYILANLFLLLLGTSLVLHTPGVPIFQRLGAWAFAPLLRAMRPMLQRPDASGRVAMGLVWGLMPCALIYSVLPLALLAGGAWQGALVMLAFGLGTLPNLLATSMLIGRAGRLVSTRAMRQGAAAMIIAFGMFGIWHVLAAPEGLAQGPFCL